MPDNASGFVDASQWADLNQGDEERLLQEAMARAEAADVLTQKALRKSEREAEGFDANGNRLGQARGFSAPGEENPNAWDVNTLENVGSYTDYLQAKKNAEAAWAAVGAESSDPRSNALRNRIRGERGMDTAATSAEAQRKVREEKVSKERIAGVSGMAAARGRSQAERAAKEAADKARADRDKQLKGDFQKTVRKKMREFWGFADSHQDNFFGANSGKGGEMAIGPNGSKPMTNFNVYGQVDPFSNNPYAQQLAAIGKNAGIEQSELDTFQGPATYSWGKRTKGGS